MKTAFKKLLCIWAAMMMVIGSACFTVSAASESDDAYLNRYKIVLVLDSSGSMSSSDPQYLRNEAVNQFVYLLAEEGNAVGAVTFNDFPTNRQEIIPITNQQDKENVVSSVVVEKPEGVTNIGGALTMAVEMLNNYGDDSLPSVIILLSDGNTEHPDKEIEQQFHDLKAEAIQAARENDIVIHTVCLNYNNRADLSEMDQIAKATGGVFRAIEKADDLQEVFNTFYNLIYGTSTRILPPKPFPASGRLEESFFVPSLGVEEINIIIYGNCRNARMIKPDQTESNCIAYYSDTFTLLKQTDVVGGKWTFVAEGEPNDEIKINMVYNTDLTIELSSSPSGNQINPNETLTVNARLKAGSQYASTAEQYIGYQADLILMNAYYETLEEIPMEVSGDHFEVSRNLEEGVYYYSVKVTSDYLEKTSEIIGPVTVDYENNNTAPVPVEPEITENVYIWPFIGGSYSLDMQTLASDEQDAELRYTIVSTSFMEDTDYRVENDVLTMEHFSLSKGSFTIAATDTGGLSCEIELIIRTHSVTLISLIIAVVIAIIVGVLVYVFIFSPHLRGTITVRAASNERGIYDGRELNKGRGRIKLTKFGLPKIDKNLVYSKCYIQATGKDYVYLKTNVPVYCPEAGGGKTKKIRIRSNRTYQICLKDKMYDPKLEVTFVAKKKR